MNELPVDPTPASEDKSDPQADAARQHVQDILDEGNEDFDEVKA